MAGILSSLKMVRKLPFSESNFQELVASEFEESTVNFYQSIIRMI